MASQSKSLTLSGISGWWPGIFPFFAPFFSGNRFHRFDLYTIFVTFIPFEKHFFFQDFLFSLNSISRLSQISLWRQWVMPAAAELKNKIKFPIKFLLNVHLIHIELGRPSVAQRLRGDFFLSFLRFLLLLPFSCFFFSRGHATLYLAVSVRPLRIILNFERFLHHGPCPTVRDRLAVYPALFFNNLQKRWTTNKNIRCCCFFMGIRFAFQVYLTFKNFSLVAVVVSFSLKSPPRCLCLSFSFIFLFAVFASYK